MVLQFSKAPVRSAALVPTLILVVVTSGYGFSQSQSTDQGWDGPNAAVLVAPAPAEIFGPPLPVTAAGDGTLDVSVPVASTQGAAPEIALTLLNRTFDRDPALFEAPDAVVNVTAPVVAEAVPSEGVRMIELPRRDDPTDAFGRPVEPVVIPDDNIHLADLPAATPPGIIADGVTELLGDGQVVPPIPVPLSLRPVPVAQPQQAISPVQVGTIRPAETVSVNPVSPVVSNEAPGTWPRRLDQVNTRPNVETYVPGRVNLGNIFMSDWVEVQTGVGRQIVAK